MHKIPLDCFFFPRKGETNPVKIQENVKKAIGEKFPLYSLGFGFDVNFEFLKKLSLENNGVGRRIYEDSDADKQLQVKYIQRNLLSQAWVI